MGRHVCAHFTELCPGVQIIRNRADLTDPAAVQAEIARAGALDLVVHLAALVPVTAVKSDPARAYAVNVTGTAHVMAGLSGVLTGGGGRPRVVYCSSSHVYAACDRPITETDPTDPVSLYGRTKLLGEQAAAYFAGSYGGEPGMELCIARVFSIHDPAQTGPYLRPSLMRRFETEDLDQPFALYGAQSQRDFLTAEQAARALVLLALSPAEGPVNIGSGCGTKVADFAQSLAPRALDIQPMGQPDVLVADITRLRSILGDQLD